MSTRQDPLALSLSQNQLVQSFMTVAYCLLGGLHDSIAMLPSQKVCCYSLGVLLYVLIFQVCGGLLGLCHRDPVFLQRNIVVPESTFFKKTSYLDSVLICVVCNFITFWTL